MQKLEFSVHEFMAIMGRLDEKLAGGKAADESVYNEWYAQWKTLDDRLETLPLMERADMLFDGKVSINFITEAHLREVVGVVKELVAMHEKLIADGDEDGDPEDLEIWQDRLRGLAELLGSSDWREAEV